MRVLPSHRAAVDDLADGVDAQQRVCMPVGFHPPVPPISPVGCTKTARANCVCHSYQQLVGAWMDGWMDGGMDGWVDGGMEERIVGWMDGWMDGWIGKTDKMDKMDKIDKIDMVHS